MKPDKQKQCPQSDEDVGVDLNRNYDFAFGIDEEGSSSDPCAEDFRGRHAFSEAATIQIKNFIEETPEGRSVRIALNLHAWGNLLVHPISYLKEPFATEHALKYRPGKLKEMLKDHLCSKDGDIFAVKN